MRCGSLCSSNDLVIGRAELAERYVGANGIVEQRDVMSVFSPAFDVKTLNHKFSVAQEQKKNIESELLRAQCLRLSEQSFIRSLRLRKGGRVVEGARLERVFT